VSVLVNIDVVIEVDEAVVKGREKRPHDEGE
jgi:hypothetical protein